MPTLIRLLIFLIFLGGLAFGGMVALTAVVDPGEKEFRVPHPDARPDDDQRERRSAQPPRPASRATGDRARSRHRAAGTAEHAGARHQSADAGHVDLRMSGSELHLVDAFLEMMSAERGAAKNTIAAYRRDLTDYGAFLSGRGSRFTAAPRELVVGWLERLAGEGLSASSSRAKTQRGAAVPQIPLRRRDPAGRSDPDRRLAAGAARPAEGADGRRGRSPADGGRSRTPMPRPRRRSRQRRSGSTFSSSCSTPPGFASPSWSGSAARR